jgi:hypothetical protein
MGIIAGSRLRASSGLILDSFSNAAIALSLRKLRAAYTGSCVKVRRSSDNTEQDIGFVNDVLDTSSLLTFVGSSDAFVKIWYDQSGEGNNASQTTNSSQPKIVNSGSVILENGKPTINFDGSKNLLVWNNTTAPTLFQDMSDQISIFIVEKSTDITGREPLWINENTIIEIREHGTASGAGTPFNLGYNESKFGYGVSNNYIYNAEKIQTTDVTVSQRISSSIVDGDNIKIHLNNVIRANTNFSVGGDRSVGSANSSFCIGSRSRDGGEADRDFITGNIQEIIIYKAVKTNNRSVLETNINAYYSIY